jgi:L-iditol 2-dehydrogenase
MKLQPGATVALIGAGNMGRLLICALKRAGARVLVIGRDAGRLELAKAAGADELIDLGREPDGIAAVRAHTPGKRGVDAVVEAVGKPETWALSMGMARKGGQVCLFGGCAKGATAELDAYRIHYDELEVFGVFHHRPKYVRKALELLGEGAVPPALLIDHQISLEDLPAFFAANRDASVLKAAVMM